MLSILPWRCWYQKLLFIHDFLPFFHCCSLSVYKIHLACKNHTVLVRQRSSRPKLKFWYDYNSISVMILAKRAKTVFSGTAASFGGIAHIYCDKPPLVYSLGPIWTLLASFLFCDRLIAGDVLGSGNTVPSSAFRVGSVAAEQLYHACHSLYLLQQCQIGERRCPSISTPAFTHQTTGGGGGLIPCYFPIRPSSPTFVPCLVPSSHFSSQREEGSEVLSVWESMWLLLYFTKKRPFIGPTRHLIGQFLHHVISGNIKRCARYMNYYDNTINCLT